MTLSRKILFLALLNMLLLGVVIFVFARLQFQAPAESLVLGPARDRLVGIANAFRLEFNSTPAAARVDLLAFLPAALRRRYLPHRSARPFARRPEIRLRRSCGNGCVDGGRRLREPSAEPRFPRGRPSNPRFW